MFIGGAPSSPAGGIRITTAYVIYLHFKNTIRGNDVINFAKIRISDATITKAYLISAGFIFFIAFSSFLMYLVDVKYSFTHYLFETTSALTTTGFSMGVTSGTTELNQVILIILMIVGRVGMLNLLYSFSARKGNVKSRIEYVEKDIVI